VVQNKAYTGFFVSDFTLAELRILRLKQRMEGRSMVYDGLLSILTLAEIMALAQERSLDLGRTVGLYVELKHLSYYAGMGMDMGEKLLLELYQGGYTVTGPDVQHDLHSVVPVVVQCYEPHFLQHMRIHATLPLVQLVMELTHRDHGLMPSDAVMDPRTTLLRWMLTSNDHTLFSPPDPTT
jgi:glycerophosphoryl diester phosphodiesterase